MNENVKNKIIQHLSEHGNSAFGDLVKSIDAPYEEVLETVLAMKHEGLVQKMQDPPGYYSLSTIIGIQ